MVVGQWKWLKSLDIAFWVIIEDYTRIHNILRVEEFFHLFHYFVSRFTPLVLDKWCHIATCAMLSLQRAVILVNHQFLNLHHEILILLHISISLKRLRNDEVIVALKCMTIYAGIVITMLQEHLLKVFCSPCQILDVECDILNNHCCAQWTSATNRWENTRTNSPIL